MQFLILFLPWKQTPPNIRPWNVNVHFLRQGNQYAEATKQVSDLHQSVYICTSILTPAPKISPIKRHFEKYKTMGLFSGFYGINFLREFYQIGQNSRNSQKLVHENVSPIKLKMRPFSVDGIVSILALQDVISTTYLRFWSAGQLMNSYRL